MNLITANIPFMDVNSYLISTDSAAIIIDPGMITDEISEFISENKEKEFGILLTHCHFDHIGGAKAAKELSGGKIYICEDDAIGLIDNEYNLSDRFCCPIDTVEADVLLADNDIVKIGNIEIKVMATPGHSKGSVCYIINDWMFSGDTLFRGSVGRIDFIGGDRLEQIESLKSLCSLNGEYEVYPGHGPATRLSFEKIYNPFIKEIKE